MSFPHARRNNISTLGVISVCLVLLFLAHDVSAAIKLKQALSEGVDATTITLEKPTTLADDDLMVVCLEKGGAPNWTTIPSFWTVLQNTGTSTGNANAFLVAYKIATSAATEPASYSFITGATSDTVGALLTFSGVSTSTPLDVSIATSAGQNRTNSNSPNPSVTTVTDSAFVMLCSMRYNGILTWEAPSSTVLRINAYGGSNNAEAGIGVATFYKEFAGATGDKQFYMSGENATDEWTAATIALRPATSTLVHDDNKGPVVITANYVQTAQNARVIGYLAKGSGTFVIDHPLDPENKLLYHSFVESPDVKNIYDGIAVFDAQGEADIALPTYFGALNEEYRYLATSLGQSQPNIYIKSEVENNRFIVAGGLPGARVSWQVTGIRKDPYIKANPVRVEVEKGLGELIDKGEYLHPAVYGKPVSALFSPYLSLLDTIRMPYF